MTIEGQIEFPSSGLPGEGRGYGRVARRPRQGGSIKDIDDPHTVTAVGLRSYCSLGVGDLPAPRGAAEIPPARASARLAPWRPKLIEHRSEEQEKDETEMTLSR